MPKNRIYKRQVIIFTSFLPPTPKEKKKTLIKTSCSRSVFTVTHAGDQLRSAAPPGPMSALSSVEYLQQIRRLTVQWNDPSSIFVFPLHVNTSGQCVFNLWCPASISWEYKTLKPRTQPQQKRNPGVWMPPESPDLTDGRMACVHLLGESSSTV